MRHYIWHEDTILYKDHVIDDCPKRVRYYLLQGNKILSTYPVYTLAM